MFKRIAQFLWPDTEKEERAIVAAQLSPVRKRVIERYVGAGALLLDANVPGWYELVNTRTLDMEDSEYCVLGQIYGEYSDGLDALNIMNGSLYGFFPEADELRYNEQLWIDAINARK